MANDKLKKMIKRHEGYSNHVYLCPAGKRTIGWGWNIDAHPLPKPMQVYLDTWGYLLPEHCEQLLDMAIGLATIDCKRLYPNFSGFTENRQNALVDFVFNVGVGTARTFKNTNRAINEGRWDDAAEGLRKSLYWKQLGGDPPGTDDGKLERPEEVAKLLRDG
jgi:lysozyme